MPSRNTNTLPRRGVLVPPACEHGVTTAAASLVLHLRPQAARMTMCHTHALVRTAIPTTTIADEDVKRSPSPPLPVEVLFLILQKEAPEHARELSAEASNVAP
jgi:hypothetical protein